MRNLARYHRTRLVDDCRFVHMLPELRQGTGNRCKRPAQFMRGQCKKLVLALDRAPQLPDEALIFVRVSRDDDPLTRCSGALLNPFTPFELSYVFGIRCKAHATFHRIRLSRRDGLVPCLPPKRPIFRMNGRQITSRNRAPAAMPVNACQARLPYVRRPAASTTQTSCAMKSASQSKCVSVARTAFVPRSLAPSRSGLASAGRPEMHATPPPGGDFFSRRW